MYKNALVYAVENKDEAMVRLLLPKKGPDVEGEVEEALEVAALKGNEALVRLLLNHIYDESDIDKESKSEKWLEKAQYYKARK